MAAGVAIMDKPNKTSSSKGAPRRVLMLATDAHGGFGGIAQYNRDVIEALSSFDRIGEIIVLPRGIGDLSFAAPAKVRYDAKAAKGMAAFVYRTVVWALSPGAVDFVYCAHINLLPLAKIVASLRRVPLVLAIYGIDAWKRPSGLAFSVPLPVDLVVSISQLTLDRYVSWANMTNAVSALVPNAIHLDGSLPPGDCNPLAKRLGVEGRKTILTFGRMAADERYKGFDEVLELMPRLVERVPDLVYVAAGEGSDRIRLENKAGVLGLSGNVVFTGLVEERDKADLYRLADAYVMPSSGEGFGFVILEALATGLPVVASSVDGTREAVRDGELGAVIDPTDKAALERAILQALERPKSVHAGLEYFSYPNFQMRLKTALSKIVEL